mgnify:CR=1 FL=1
MTDLANTLPVRFAHLEPFVAMWDLPDFQARLERRASVGMAEIQKFYEIISQDAEAIRHHLEKFDLNDLPAQEAVLFRLFMALAHVAMSVEQHGQPLPASCVYPNSIRLGEGLSPA